MNTKPMLPVITLSVGTKLTPRRHLNRVNVQQWRYASEFPDNFSSLSSGAVLEIFEINKVVPAWVKAYLPHTHNTMFLKIGGEELSWNFLLVG